MWFRLILLASASAWGRQFIKDFKLIFFVDLFKQANYKTQVEAVWKTPKILILLNRFVQSIQLNLLLFQLDSSFFCVLAINRNVAFLNWALVTENECTNVRDMWWHFIVGCRTGGTISRRIPHSHSVDFRRKWRPSVPFSFDNDVSLHVLPVSSTVL